MKISIFLAKSTAAIVMLAIGGFLSFKSYRH